MIELYTATTRNGHKIPGKPLFTARMSFRDAQGSSRFLGCAQDSSSERCRRSVPQLDGTERDDYDAGTAGQGVN